MAGIKNIRDLYKKVGEKGLREVLEGEIRVTEKFDAYRFAFEKNPHNYKIYFYGKNGKAPLSKIDRTVSDLYEAAISYIENLPADIKKAIPVRHRFGFSWFPTNKPLNTEYGRRPKKGLVLTDITVRNRDRDVTSDIKENRVFERWANVFGVETTKPLFEGRLDEGTINSLVEMAQNDYTLQSLNESQVSTQSIFSGNIEALVFESEDGLFKVESVITEEKKAEKRSHLFDVLLLDICEHLNRTNILNIKPVSVHSDEAYIEVVSEVFNEFVEKRGRDFLQSGLSRPKFLEKSGKFNKAWIKNPKTLALVEGNKDYEYLYTVFLANLRKPKYSSGLLSEAVVNQFNQKIEEISRTIEDDYSFLEFTTIVREQEEKPAKTVEPVKAADIEKSLVLLQAFFHSSPVPKTKELVEVIICNCALFSNQILKEAQKVSKESGKRIILFHDAKYDSLQVDTALVEKMLSRIVEENNDVFIGYHILNVPTMEHILKKCGNFYPERIHCPVHKYQMLNLENDAIAATSGENHRKIAIEKLTNKIYSECINAFEKDDQNAYKKSTPDCIHGYWSGLKSAFDRYYYY